MSLASCLDPPPLDPDEDKVANPHGGVVKSKRMQ